MATQHDFRVSHVGVDAVGGGAGVWAGVEGTGGEAAVVAAAVCLPGAGAALLEGLQQPASITAMMGASATAK